MDTFLLTDRVLTPPLAWVYYMGAKESYGATPSLRRDAIKGDFSNRAMRPSVSRWKRLGVVSVWTTSQHSGAFLLPKAKKSYGGVSWQRRRQRKRRLIMGSIYRPKYKDRQGKFVESNVWWVKYYSNGKPFRESSKSKKKGNAERLLKLREGQIAEHRFPGLRVEKITFDELAEGLLSDYQEKRRKSLDRAELSVRTLKKHFEGVRVTEITTDKIKGYILKRRGEGVTDATITRELAALKRMFNLGAQSTPPKVVKTPYIPSLSESTPREGFFEHGEYEALKNALPSHLRPVIIMAYYTGMRLGEIRNLQWGQVNLIEGKINLKAGTTKNNEARVIYMAPELLESIRFQKALRNNKHPECPWVFFNEHGECIGRFDKSWKNACKKTGLNGKLFHDFRRTAIRDMVRAGVPERVAMMVSGHKTRSVFERYNVVDESDLERASKKVAEYHIEKAKKPHGQSLGKDRDNDRVSGKDIVPAIH